MNLIQVTCSNNNCNRTFRVPEYQYGKTIKNNPDKQECLNCKNKKLLSRSTLYDKKGREKKQVKSSFYNANNKVIKSGKNVGGKKQRKKQVKWEDKPLNKMIQHVQDNFCNPYIRARDIDSFGRCISCNSSITQAGHRYSVGDFPGMRFWINNIHGQEISCNHFKSGNIDAFDRGLRSRHGDKYTDDLKQQSLIYLRGGHKFYVFDVLEIGKTYKYLLQNKIWVFTREEFNQERSKLFK